MEVGTVLLAAGLRIVETLIVGWIRDGRDRVRVREANQEISRAVRANAESLRLRVDDLERSTRWILNDLVTSSAQLSYSGTRRNAMVVLAYDPRDALSSESMLRSLRERVDEIEHSHVLVGDHQLEPGQLPAIPTDSGTAEPRGMSWSASPSHDKSTGGPTDGVAGGQALPADAPKKSQLLIRDLKERIARAEDERR